MKITKLTLTLSLLTVTPYAAAMMLQENLSQPDMLPETMQDNLQNMIPNATMQKKAITLYNQLEGFEWNKGDFTVTLPQGFADLLKNSLTFAHEMKMPDVEKAIQLEIAYNALEFPPFAFFQLTRVMGHNAKFMKAFTMYSNTWNEYQMAWGTLRMDVENASSKTNPTENLTKIISLEKSIKSQLTALKKMFMQDPANKIFMDRITKFEYLCEQYARWSIAFAMAINPDMVQSALPEIFEKAKEAAKLIFTSDKVNTFKKRIKEAKQR